MEALERASLLDLKDRSVDSLSGGQRQRAWIAMTLAQDTDVILLDEPTTYLDLAHQIDVLDLLYDLNREQNKTIVMVLHDLNLACRYAHFMVAIANKSILQKVILLIFWMHRMCVIFLDWIVISPLIPYLGRRCVFRLVKAINALLWRQAVKLMTKKVSCHDCLFY